MKVTSIKIKKESPLRTRIYNVEVKYTVGTRGTVEHTDVFEWDLMNDKGIFPEDINIFKRESLEEITRAYFTLIYYGFIENPDEE